MEEEKNTAPIEADIEIGTIEETTETDEGGAPETDPKKKKPTLQEEIWSYAKTIALAFVLAFLITNFIIVNCNVPTGSMMDTIIPKDRVIGSRLSFLFSEPERGDIIIFKYPDDETGDTIFIKRVVGLPGETIQVINNRIYINGSTEPLEEPYLDEIYLTGGAGRNFGPFTIPEGEYFMMGDHRNNSNDSRLWKNKTVPKNQILGKALFTYWPFNHAKWLDVDYEY